MREQKRIKSKILLEFEQLKKHSLYEVALEEVLSSERNAKIIKPIEIWFSVNYETAFGQKLAIVGSGDALGNWDPLKAADMQWNEGNIWRLCIFSDKLIKDAHYKYVCISEENVIWEGGEDKTISISQTKTQPDLLKFYIDDIWQG